MSEQNQQVADTTSAKRPHGRLLIDGDKATERFGAVVVGDICEHRDRSHFDHVLIDVRFADSDCGPELARFDIVGPFGTVELITAELDRIAKHVDELVGAAMAGAYSKLAGSVVEAQRDDGDEHPAPADIAGQLRWVRNTLIKCATTPAADARQVLSEIRPAIDQALGELSRQNGGA